MSSLIHIRRRLGLAVLVTALIVVTGAAVARSAVPGDPFDAIQAKLSQLSTQISQVNGNTNQLSSQVSALGDNLGQLDSKLTQLDAKITQLDAKLTQVDSRTVDISTDLQLLKQLANSTHDRLTVVCRNVNYTWNVVEHIAAPDATGLADPHNCWRNYYDPGYAATFSSRWTDPIP